MTRSCLGLWVAALAMAVGLSCGPGAALAQTTDAPPAPGAPAIPSTTPAAPAAQTAPAPGGDPAAPAAAPPGQPADQAPASPATVQPGAPPPAAAPPAAVPPTPSAPAARPAAGLPATVVDLHEAEAILGKSVVSATNEDMGRIVDVIVSGDGHTRAAVIDFGGFLGVGSRKVVVDWSSLQFGADGKVGQITLALTRNQLRLTPEYKAGEPIVIMGMPPPAAQPSSAAAQAPSSPQTATTGGMTGGTTGGTPPVTR